MFVRVCSRRTYARINPIIVGIGTHNASHTRLFFKAIKMDPREKRYA